MKYINVAFLLFVLINAILAQNSNDNLISVDTSYNINSEEIKVKKVFPFAERVVAQQVKEVKEFKDIVYRTYGTRNLHLNLFVPEGRNKTYPAVIFIHGGGWHSGNKSLQYPLAQKISTFGYVTAAVEYRLSGEEKFPAAIIDIKSAIKWLKLNAEKYSVDTSKIVVSGSSAGGQIASLTGMTNGDPEFEDNYLSDKVTSNVAAILNIDGLVDFTGPESKEFDTDPEKPRSAHIWLGNSFKNNPEIWRYASPLYHFNKNCVPVLFINSSNPRYHSGRDALIRLFDENHIYYEMHTIGNTPHTFWLFHPWFEKTTEYIRGFLNTLF